MTRGFDDLTRISGIIICANPGVVNLRVSQYFDDLVPEKERPRIEQALMDKAAEDDLEVMQFEQYIVVFRMLEVPPLTVIVIGDVNSNELFLERTIDVFDVALGLLWPKETRSIAAVDAQIENLYLLIDEVIDQGFVFCGSGEIAAARVTLAEDDAFAGKSTKNKPAFS